MEQTIQDLAALLLKALPTIFFFALLTVYLKYVFFKPIERIFEERRKATEGVRDLARRALEAADDKQSQFDRALQLARAELHKEHEELRRQWAQEQLDALASARAEVERRIAEARQEIAREVEQAQSQLDAQVEGLSDRIIDSLLRRRAA